MKKIFLIFFILFLGLSCFAYDEVLRDYDNIELAKGTFIPVISAQEISTQYCDINSKVKFIATTDLYLYDTNIIPQNSEFYGYIEKINEPVIGTNASMIIKITKLKFPDGVELPMKGYIQMFGSTIIGGELTAPASFEKKPSYRQGYPSQVGYVPGPSRKMGEHKIIASGTDLIIVLTGPLYITHTVTN